MAARAIIYSMPAGKTEIITIRQISESISPSQTLKKSHQWDINGNRSHSNTRQSLDQQLRVSWRRKGPGDTVNRTKTNTYPSTMRLAMAMSSLLLLAQNLGTVFAAQVDVLVVRNISKPLSSRVNFCVSEIGSWTWSCVSHGSESPEP